MPHTVAFCKSILSQLTRRFSEWPTSWSPSFEFSLRQGGWPFLIWLSGVKNPIVWVRGCNWPFPCGLPP